MKNKSVLFILSCLLTNLSYGINSSTVCNDTHQQIVAVWTAYGCAHIRYDKHLVCSSAILNPGECSTYQYHWGATSDSVHIGAFFVPTLDAQGKDEMDGLPADFYAAGDYYAWQNTNTRGTCQFHSDDKSVKYVHQLNAYFAPATSSDHQGFYDRHVDCSYSSSSSSS